MQNREVAIKELRLPAGASEDELREAKTWFARESYLLSTLQHPLIPHFYSVFLEEDRSYIVQEYVDGENLEQVIARQGPLPEDAVVQWASALCDLLIYLHDQAEPVIFRDLKPANILLRSADRSLVVVDFGIARPYQLDVVGTIVGTPGYAPPEQYQGLATPRSDIYALGATLYRLVTGYDPEHEAPFTFPPVRTLNAAVSLPFAAVIERAVALNPQDRFASAADMSAALGRVRLRPFMGQGPARGRGNSRRTWSGVAVAVLLAPLLLRALAATQGPAIGPAATLDQGTYPIFSGGYCMPLDAQLQSADPSAQLAPGAGIMSSGGSLWFTDQSTTEPALDYLASNGEMGACPLNGAIAAPLEVVSGPDGDFWLSEADGSIEHFTQQGGTSGYQAAPAHITIGPDDNLWFTQPATDRIGQWDPSGGVQEFSLQPGESAPNAIAAGPGDALWFTEQTNRIGRLSVQGTPLPGFDVPDRTPVGLAGITQGPDRNMWFTEAIANKVGTITGAGAIKVFAVPTRNAGLGAIVAGPRGACWFVEQRANKIGEVTADGHIQEFAIPSPNSGPTGITVGPDGNIWFTEMRGARLGRLDPVSGRITEIVAVAGIATDVTRGRPAPWSVAPSLIPRPSASVPGSGAQQP